jgi:hypothetical protein
MSNAPNLQGSKWESKLSKSLVIDFYKDPIAHTFVSLVPPGQLSILVREAIRYFVEGTNHPAGDPEVQRRLATQGVTEMVAGIVQSCGRAKQGESALGVSRSVASEPVLSPAVAAYPVPEQAPPSSVSNEKLAAASSTSGVDDNEDRVAPSAVTVTSPASSIANPSTAVSAGTERKRTRLLDAMLELGEPSSAS